MLKVNIDDLPLIEELLEELNEKLIYSLETMIDLADELIEEEDDESFRLSLVEVCEKHKLSIRYNVWDIGCKIYGKIKYPMDLFEDLQNVDWYESFYSENQKDCKKVIDTINDVLTNSIEDEFDDEYKVENKLKKVL